MTRGRGATAAPRPAPFGPRRAAGRRARGGVVKAREARP
jgi:hypothetical protein